MTACSSILCDACSSPGHCCFGFELNTEYFETDLEAMVFLATVKTSMVNDEPVRGGNPENQNFMIGLPFLPLMNTPGRQRRYWCSWLDIKTGKCSNYENRPALCRHYKAGSDNLCAMNSPKKPMILADLIKKDVCHAD